MLIQSRLVQASLIIVAAFFFMGLGQNALQLKMSGTRYPSLMPQQNTDETNTYQQSYLRLGLTEMLSSLRILTHMPEQEYPTTLVINNAYSCLPLDQGDESKNGLAYKWSLSYGSIALAPKTILHALESLGQCGTEDIHLVVGY